LHPSIVQAVAKEGYQTPTPIQLQAIPPVLQGKDLLGIAQTGTGKTAAFALPILHRLAAAPNARKPGTTRVLVLVPTRELAIQVRESFDRYGSHLNVHSTCIFGGVSEGPQKKAMARGVDILVATPGRLLDLLGQRALHFSSLGVFVLDEADRMLDMGFINDINKIVALLPQTRQNLFFSATMPADIAVLASRILRNPVRVEVTPSATPIEIIDQVVYAAEKREKQLPIVKFAYSPWIQ
jgi:ATP-dependent RNA helicase RhlE